MVQLVNQFTPGILVGSVNPGSFGQRATQQGGFQLVHHQIVLSHGMVKLANQRIHVFGKVLGIEYGGEHPVGIGRE